MLDLALPYMDPRSIVVAGRVCSLWRPASDVRADRGKRNWAQVVGCYGIGVRRHLLLQGKVEWQLLHRAWEGISGGHCGTVRVAELETSISRFTRTELVVDGDFSIVLRRCRRRDIASVRVYHHLNKELRYVASTEGASPMCITAGRGEFAVGASDECIRIFKTESGRSTQLFRREVGSESSDLSLSATHLAVLWKDGVDVYDRATSAVVRQIRRRDEDQPRTAIRLGADRIEVAHMDGRIAIWSLLPDVKMQGKVGGESRDDSPLDVVERSRTSSGLLWDHIALHCNYFVFSECAPFQRDVRLVVQDRRTGQTTPVHAEGRLIGRPSIVGRQLLFAVEDERGESGLRGWKVWGCELSRLDQPRRLVCATRSMGHQSVDIGAGVGGVVLLGSSGELLTVPDCGATRAAWLSLADELGAIEVGDDETGAGIQARIQAMPPPELGRVMAWHNAIAAAGGMDPAVWSVAIRCFVIESEPSEVRLRLFAALSRLTGCSAVEAEQIGRTLGDRAAAGGARLDLGALQRVFAEVDNLERIELARQALAGPLTDAWWARFYDLPLSGQEEAYARLTVLMPLPTEVLPQNCFAGRGPLVASNAQRAEALLPTGTTLDSIMPKVA